jgi:hypothetical protein
MDLVACRYIDFPSIETIDLDAPELPSNDQEMLEVATERMFVEPSILETIASVVSTLRQYESAGSSAPPAALKAAEGVLEESTAGAESVEVACAPSLTREDQGASLPQPVETVTSAAAAVVADAAESVVGEVGPSSPHPVAAAAEEVLVPGKPAATPQAYTAFEGMTRTASSEAEEDTSATLFQGAVSGEVQTLELACTSWAPGFESGDDAKDDEEVAARSTLERWLEWARRAFDELILPRPR